MSQIYKSNMGSSPGGDVETLTGNTGSPVVPVAHNINVVTANSTAVFNGVSPTLTLDFGISNLIVGSKPPVGGAQSNSGFGDGTLILLNGGLRNTAVGNSSASNLTGADDNVAIGYKALNSGNADGNVAVGSMALFSCTSAENTAVGGGALESLLTNGQCCAVGYSALTNSTGAGNTAVGFETLSALTADAGRNTAIGSSCGLNLLTGGFNLIFGQNSANNYTTSESSNIIIGNPGTVGESNTIRLGNQGTASQQQNICYIAGIIGNSVSNQQFVTINSSTGQLGVTAFQTIVKSFIAKGSAVPLTTATASNVTSISLVAGTWEISGIIQFTGSPTVSGPQIASISTTSATNGTLGDNSIETVVLATNFTVGDIGLSIPSYILTIASTTTVYLVAQGTFSVGSLSAYGRISAIKIIQ